MVDLSGATTADFQEQGTAPRAEFVALGEQQPDIVRHDPNTFAALTAQTALKTLYQQGLQPTGDDIKGVYNKALESANDYQKSLAQEQERAQLELKKRAAEMPMEIAKEKQLKQWEQTGEIQRPPDADIARVNGFEQGYQTVQKLQGYHGDMAAEKYGGGGIVKSMLPGIGALDQPTKDFNAYLESSIVPLGRGVFGDAATAATKESIQANMRDMLPNTADNVMSAGHKVYMLKDRIMQNLITDRNNAEAAHKDTTLWDKAIGRLSSDYTSDATRQYAPTFAKQGQQQPNMIVQNGVSTPATANMDAQLIASAQAQQTQTAPGGSADYWAQAQPQQPQPVQAQPQQQQQPQQGLNAWGF
jgi:hypothetical protein